MQKALKDANKLVLTDENQELIEIHKKQEIGNNFIMKSFKKMKQQEAGIESSEKESSIDDEFYYNTI